MRDTLDERLKHAIEENHRLRGEMLKAPREHISLDNLRALRLSVIESAMLRAEIKALRDNAS
jgi:hypothetical protein